MSEEERKDYLNYIENYTIHDLADEFNTQSFVIKDTNKFNELLLYYHFKDIDEIEELQQENQQLKERVEYLERSNNRREDTIISLRYELVTTESVLDEIREYVNRQEVNSIGSFFADTPIGKDLLQILDKVKE